MYASIHVFTHYPIFNHHDNWSFWANGSRILNSFPKNSIVLLNGDLNNNLIKYPQQCEGLRKDVDLLSLQLMTWDWFVPMQKHNYNNTV